MLQYWIALHKKGRLRRSQGKTKVLTLLAPNRDIAKRTAERRWPSYRAVFIEPLSEVLPGRVLDIQRAVRQGVYYLDADALSERLIVKVTYDHALECHQQLGEDHQRARAQLDNLKRFNAFATIEEFVGELQDVYSDVSWHFAREEMSTGLYRCLESLCGCGGVLRQLRREHFSILTSFESILARLAAPIQQPAEERLHDAALGTSALIQQCHEHEYREHMLTERALSR